METNSPIIENYGILASMSWNSNKWADEPTVQDLKASKYGYVKDKSHMHESLNFGHEIYPAEPNGYFIGYTPMFNRPPDIEKSKYVEILFLLSSDYANGNRKSIVGFYGFPYFGDWYDRSADHPIYKKYDSGNIQALPEDIIYFETPIVINNDIVKKEAFLPDGKLISQQGFNYLNSDNVHNLVIKALQLNPTNKKLKLFVQKFPLLVHTSNEVFELQDFYQVVGDSTADSVDGITELEKLMNKQSPNVRTRISAYIERGAIANKVKKLAGYKCLICEAMGLHPFSFKKPNGNPYIETHHVEPVSTLKKGVLSINNLITVCANHHRQLHYGNSEVIENTSTNFKFKIDGRIIEVKTIRLI